MTINEALAKLLRGLELRPNPLAERRPDGSQPSLYAALDYLSIAGFRWEEDKELPEQYRWVAAYVVTGDSEGLYIHVDLVLEGYTLPNEQTTVQQIATGKTFHDWDCAWLIAAACAKILDA